MCIFTSNDQIGNFGEVNLQSLPCKRLKLREFGVPSESVAAGREIEVIWNSEHEARLKVILMRY